MDAVAAPRVLEEVERIVVVRVGVDTEIIDAAPADILNDLG